jgi:hypothetical protein
MIVETMTFMKALIDLVSINGMIFKRMGQMLLQPLLTVAIGMMVYGGWFVIREDSISVGLHAAFVSNSGDKPGELAIIQAEISRTAEANRVIDQILTSALANIPGAARIRLAVIHNGIAGVTGLSMLRSDITNAIARPGRATGDLSVNLPMGSLATFSPSMLDGSCWLNNTNNLSFNPGREHLERVGVKTFLACPVKDPNGLLLGEIALHWDSGDTVPVGADMERVTNDLKVVTDRVGGIITLRSNPLTRSQNQESKDQ